MSIKIRVFFSFTFLLLFQQAISQAEYRGGFGSGDQSVAKELIAINGEPAPNIYIGGYGHGDVVSMPPMLAINGTESPQIYKGGVGRGDNATTPTQAWLVDCNVLKVWTGEKDTNWHNESNWSCEVVPGPQHKVYIPEGRPFYPIISGNVTILRLEVQPDAKVSLQQNARLIITGTGQ